MPRLPNFSWVWISGDPSWACMLLLLFLHHTSFRKGRNSLTRWVSRHSDFDAPVAEIQLPLNFGWSLLSMDGSATCSTSDFFRKRWNALTMWVSHHSNLDAPVAKIQLPLNLGDPSGACMLPLLLLHQTTSANGETIWLGEFHDIPTSMPRLPKFSWLWISGDPSWACMLLLLVLHHTSFRKRPNALTRWVSRHSNFDAPVAEIQLPLNFGGSLLSMYAFATCSVTTRLSKSKTQ